MNNSNGWISLHRSLLQWEWYTDPNTFRVFMHLLLNANHSRGKHQGTVIEIGQVKTGRKTIANQLTLSEQNVRTSLIRLKSTNEITIKSFNTFSIISITNWDKYQNKYIDQPASQLHANQQVTSNQPASNQQVTSYLTTNNNINNNNNENKNNKNNKKEICGRNQKIVELYKLILPDLPTVLKLSPQRVSKINKICNELLKNKQDWDDYFQTVKESDFLMGVDGKWRADFEWLINSNNAVKILEGRYKNNQPKETDYFYIDPEDRENGNQSNYINSTAERL